MLLNKDGQHAWPGLAKHSQQTSPPITDDHRRSSSVDRRRWHLVNSKIMIEQNVPSQQEGDEGDGGQFYWQCSGLYAIISRSLAIVTNRQRQRIDSSPVGSHISEASFETSLGAIKRRTHFLRSPPRPQCGRSRSLWSLLAIYDQCDLAQSPVSNCNQAKYHTREVVGGVHHHEVDHQSSTATDRITQPAWTARVIR